MLESCRASARRLGVHVCVYQQEVASLQLPEWYSMVFIPSGSIGLLAEDEELRTGLTRIRSHMQPNAEFLLEVPACEQVSSEKVRLESRTVVCADGASITYSCTVSKSSWADSVRFTGLYEKRRGGHVIDTEHEELILRMYSVERVVEELTMCGFRSIVVSTVSEKPFLSESGCTLIEARADAGAYFQRNISSRSS